ncbi:MAG TPA: SURF1 family protein [Nocardioidaceae bacterium]|nr:SURF1 family protein [Nocardioidaceae bacterium]
MRRDLGLLISPRLLPLHLLGVAATVAAVLLGLWQLDAWQAQRESAARDLSTLAPVPLDDVLDPDQPFPSSAVGRPVKLTGTWVPASTFYVTDRELEGRNGSWAVTPVAVCDAPSACPNAPALLVARGWVADPDDAPAPPEGEVELTGWLQPPEGSGRPDPDPADDRLPDVRIADAIQRVDQDLYGAYLIAETAEPALATEGLEAVTPDSLPEPDTSTGLRNFLYGIQWFVFGAFAVFVWWRWARDELERLRASQQALATPEPEEAEVPSEP